MYAGKLVFAQVMDHMPIHTFRRCVTRYRGHDNIRSFSCLDQYLCMAFAQLTYRESLRDIEACLRAQQTKLYHMGIRGRVSRSTLADANERRDWRIHADLAQTLIGTEDAPTSSSAGSIPALSTNKPGCAAIRPSSPPASIPPPTTRTSCAASNTATKRPAGSSPS